MDSIHEKGQKEVIELYAWRIRISRHGVGQAGEFEFMIPCPIAANKYLPGQRRHELMPNLYYRNNELKYG